MIHSGTNLIDGVSVEVIRKRIRCINIRVKADGGVVLSIPKWWSTLREGEAFLREKWKWITKARAEILARPVALRTPVTDEEIESLRPMLGELTDLWSARLHESGVTWKLLRRKLNKREFEPKLPTPPKPARLIQSDFTATLFGAKVENGILCL
ncbi:MAG: DUF45 domain-containing protein [bacterium]|nr:DUF45 domain-containing protein [Candidatus Colisoma equi]